MVSNEMNLNKSQLLELKEFFDYTSASAVRTDLIMLFKSYLIDPHRLRNRNIESVAEENLYACNTIERLCDLLDFLEPEENRL